MRLVPEDCRNICGTNCLDPLVHVRPEFGVVRAGGNFGFPVYRDLAHVMVSGCEFGIGFAAKHAAYAPWIHIYGESHCGRLVYELLHGVIIVLQILFAPRMEDGVESGFFYLYKVNTGEFRGTYSEIADTFNHCTKPLLKTSKGFVTGPFGPLGAAVFVQDVFERAVPFVFADGAPNPERAVLDRVFGERHVVGDDFDNPRFRNGVVELLAERDILFGCVVGVVKDDERWRLPDNQCRFQKALGAFDGIASIEGGVFS